MSLKQIPTVQIAVLVAVALLTAGVSSFADGASPGQKAPAFTLQDTSGTSHSLSDFDGKIVVLEWTNYLCPFVKKHYRTGNMQALQKEYTGKGVVWLSVNSSAPGKQGHFSPAEWQRHIEEQDAAPTAVLLDPDGKVGRAYGAKTTPHMFVINTEGKLLYKGAIDDKATFKPADVETASNYVKEVLDSLLAGEDVDPTENRPYGCSVKY